MLKGIQSFFAKEAKRVRFAAVQEGLRNSRAAAFAVHAFAKSLNPKSKNR
jgi:hypothetical protein